MGGVDILAFNSCKKTKKKPKKLHIGIIGRLYITHIACLLLRPTTDYTTVEFNSLSCEGLVSLAWAMSG
jgi:hypothetical protein